MPTSAPAARGVSFVLLSDPAFVEEACAELSARFEFTKRRRGLWLPQEILGMWVGPEPDFLLESPPKTEEAPSARPAVDLTVENVFGFAQRWMIIHLKSRQLTRNCLLDKLVANPAGLPKGHPPRFIPVFPRIFSDTVRRAELAKLQARHPHELCPPRFMNPMTGSLSAI